MAKLVVEKECLKCNKKLFNVDIATRYCPECKKEVKREQSRKEHKNNTIKKDTKSKLDENIKTLNPHNHQLTPIVFNKISPINIYTYMNYYQKSWIEVLRIYNLENELIDYVLVEYKNYMKNTDSQDINAFARFHGHMSPTFLKSIGYDYLRELANVKKLRYTKQDYRDNFLNIVNQLGRVPLLHEFMKMSPIKPGAYAKHLKLSGTIYENIVKHYVYDIEYEKYIEHNKLYRKELGIQTGGLSALYKDEDYEKEFHRVFEFCIKEYKNYPSRRLFNHLSSIDESAYRGKYNRSWMGICEMYGYEVDKTANKSEKVLLEVIKSVLKEDYIPQQTFDWLLGVKNFKLFCDGYYPNHRLIVEFDGKQHREPIDKFGGMKSFLVLQENDQIKNELIPQNGLKLVRVSSEEPFWNKEYIRNKLIKSNVLINAI